MHTFVYEVEYQKDYSVCHLVYKSEVLADDWHEAVGFIQGHILRLLNGAVIKITLIKEV